MMKGTCPINGLNHIECTIFDEEDVNDMSIFFTLDEDATLEDHNEHYELYRMNKTGEYVMLKLHNDTNTYIYKLEVCTDLE